MCKKVNLKRKKISTLSILSWFLGCSKEVIVKRQNERSIIREETSERVRWELGGSWAFCGSVYFLRVVVWAKDFDGYIRREKIYCTFLRTFRSPGDRASISTRARNYGGAKTRLTIHHGGRHRWYLDIIMSGRSRAHNHVCKCLSPRDGVEK